MYRDKYLKYKTKYNNLKMFGGSAESTTQVTTKEVILKFCTKILNNIKYDKKYPEEIYYDQFFFVEEPLAGCTEPNSELLYFKVIFSFYLDINNNKTLINDIRPTLNVPGNEESHRILKEFLPFDENIQNKYKNIENMIIRVIITNTIYSTDQDIIYDNYNVSYKINDYASNNFNMVKMTRENS